MRTLITLALCATLTTAPLVAAPFRAKGVFANVFLQDASGCTQAVLYLTQDGTRTFVFYQLVDVCTTAPQAIFLAEGSGTAPADGLVVSADRRTARVRLTVTGADPTLDTRGFVGTIDVTLTRSDLWSAERHVVTRQTFATGTSLKINGTYAEYSATARGVVFGYGLDEWGASSYLGTTRDLVVDVTR